MPTTRQQAAQVQRVGVYLTLDDTARSLTRVSGCIHSIANYVNDTVDSRPGFFERFRRSGENSSANARALWRFHDRRWAEKLEGRDGEAAGIDDEESDEEESPIDEEVDQRIGRPFSFTRAVEVTMDYLRNAINILRERKGEMEAWSDVDGAIIVTAFIDSYETEMGKWETIREHLARCSTYLGESFLDSSIRYGWL